MVVNLIGGAVGSSDAGIANMVHLMATEAGEVAKVCDDPTLIEAFVEEVLRFRPPFRSSRRKAVRDLEIAGEHLAAGETVYISRQAANRDPERFSDQTSSGYSVPGNVISASATARITASVKHWPGSTSTLLPQ